MRSLEQKIEALKEGTKYSIPRVSINGKLYRVTPNAIQLNCLGMIWIPKSQITDIDETTGEMILSNWIEQKILAKPTTSSGAY